MAPEAFPTVEELLNELREQLRRRGAELASYPLSSLTSRYWAADVPGDPLPLHAEFVWLAAALIDWKARFLLLAHPGTAGASSGAHSPALPPTGWRQWVADQLEIQWSRERGALFADGEAPMSEAPVEEDEPLPAAPTGPATLADLIETLERALTLAARRTSIRVEPDPWTVEDMLATLRREIAGGILDAEGWLRAPGCRTGEAACFLALLELARNGEILLAQPEPFAPLTAAVL